MEKLEVVSPAGLEAVKATGTASRLPDLNGRTVGEVWNGVFKGTSPSRSYAGYSSRNIPT
jgi:hypothetical protein